jgi:hypothetical protein
MVRLARHWRAAQAVMAHGPWALAAPLLHALRAVVQIVGVAVAVVVRVGLAVGAAATAIETTIANRKQAQAAVATWRVLPVRMHSHKLEMGVYRAFRPMPICQRAPRMVVSRVLKMVNMDL